MDEDAHQGEIAQHGDQAVRKMKPQQLSGERGVVAAVAPSVLDVPNEVVDKRELDGCGGGVGIMARRTALDEVERGKLDDHAHRCHKIEPGPASERVYGSGSWR